MKVGIILIATGIKYYQFIEPVIKSIEKNFKPSSNVTIFLFTDSKREYTKKQFYQEDLGYPGATLWRYRTILKQEEELKKMDYLYYMDVDMLIVDKIDKEILSDLVATRHPGYMNNRGTYETNPESLAYVKDDEGTYYFCGGFNGGKTSEYLKIARELNDRIEKDYDNNVIAIWHDESHLNRYLIDNPPTKILSPSYCYPEPPDDDYYRNNKWTEIYPPKILALDKNMRKEKVSIIIPCYNQAKYLSHAIESALAQTYGNIEIIVVNDGSPDNTSEVAGRYPIKLIEQDNKGLCGARNAGIEIATGDFFLPLDADDCIDENYLAKTVPLMRDKDVAVVYTALQSMNEDHELQEAWCHPLSEITLPKLKYNNQLYVCSLIRMNVLKECGGYNPNMIHGYEDWNLWIDIIKRGWKFTFVPEPLFHYMIKGKSMATEAFHDWHQWNLEQIMKNHPDVYR